MSLDAAAFRCIMGTFATGVTVVTTGTCDHMHGFTVNSLTSLSLDPLLLLICVDRRAAAHRELQKCGAFGVSILASDQEGVSASFAKSGAAKDVASEGIALRSGASGVPLIEGALGWLECALEDVLDGGDHSIFIGRVTGGEMGEGRPPLVYFGGGYRRLQD